MPTFTVHTSSSLTRLAAALAGTLAADPAPPLVREPVVVLSNGMGRWLSMELAATDGVSAGMEFSFPNDTLDACFRSMIPGLPESSPFTLDTMAWRIAALLPAHLQRPGFESIAGYLGDRGDDRRLLQLSRKLADTFDQYTIFRPQMVLGWDNGQGSDWQAELWRSLTAGCGGLHRAALLRIFRQRLNSGVAEDSLPRRISLFGISFLPPFHLEFFSILSRVTQVDFYLLNPCGSYWGDIFSERRKAELALNPDLPPEALEYYETGNPLLSSLGTQGQEFFSLLLDMDTDWNDLDSVRTPQAGGLLATIQSDILELSNRGVTTGRATMADNDLSLQIHSCHGPLREMEILYDNLLRMFDDHPDLEPRDICVMTPDIGACAPYITATFGTRCGGRPAIPFTIADQSRRRENPVLDTFLKILELPAGRFGINGMLEVLECPQVMARFEITSDELDRIREWLQSSGVRWGIDGTHRASLGFPDFGEFSWRAGLERMLLGYALAPDGDRLFAGIMPCDNIEGRQALALGKLATFINAAEGLADALSDRLTLTRWADTLTTITDRMLSPLDGNDTSCVPLHAAFQSLRESGERSGFDAPIGLEAVRDCLTGLLDESGESFGFLGGRVTFCAMLPMRSIPLRVVCLVGMNDGIFPRNQRLPAFSLMNGARRRGDRSIRDEDRYLFLEALLSARDTFYISYTGQNDRDNSSLPPSVVVAELLDYVRRGFGRAEAPDTPPEIVTRHRLQAFSSEYFSGDQDARLFSYSTEYRDALESGRASGRPRREFIHNPLEDDPLLTQELDLQQLTRFLGNPARTFLSRSLGVLPYNLEDEIEEREPFALESLAGYALRQELTGRLLNNESCDGLYESVRARSILPPLAAGRIAFDAALTECSEFARLVAAQLSPALEPLPFSLDLHGATLNGVLKELHQDRHLRWRCATMKGKDRLALWCEHLILNTVQPEGCPRESRMVCKDVTVTLQPLDNARELLAGLLELYRQGLCRPLHFFPQASWLYLSDGMAKAEERWLGSDYSLSPAESTDPSFNLCFNGHNVLDDEFVVLAERIYGPLRDVATEEKSV
ncbi:MAG: exodeoxyribonuclease V subunit gamma [Desulfuromonadales bacterium]|nr:exodeoxyribonuclease V subunit gamma [Desulfuromonadales bacterium]